MPRLPTAEYGESTARVQQEYGKSTAKAGQRKRENARPGDALTVNSGFIATSLFTFEGEKTQFQRHLQSKKRDAGLFTSLYFALFIKDEMKKEPPDLKDQAAGVQKTSLVQRVGRRILPR